MDRESKLDPEVLKGMFEQGFMGIEIPEKHGGVGGCSLSWRSRRRLAGKVAGWRALGIDSRNRRQHSSSLNAAGASFLASCLAIEEISKVDAAVGVCADVQNTLVRRGGGLAMAGSDSGSSGGRVGGAFAIVGQLVPSFGLICIARPYCAASAGEQRIQDVGVS